MKTFIGIIALMLSFNTFACSVSNPMAADLLFLSGVTKKLQDTPAFEQYTLKSISNANFAHIVLMKNTVNGKCIKVIMESHGDGSCEFDADIRGYQNAKCE